MMSNKNATLIIVGFVMLFLLGAVLLSKNTDRAPAVAVAPEDVNFQLPDETKVVETKTVYVLRPCNLRAGPSTSFPIEEKLVIFEDLTVEDNGEKWLKVISPYEGFIRSDLVGTLEQAQDQYMIEVSRQVMTLMNAGIVKWVKKEKVYVDPGLWLQINLETRKVFMQNYSLYAKLQGGNGLCVIYNNYNHGMIMWYNLETNTFSMF